MLFIFTRIINKCQRLKFTKLCRFNYIKNLIQRYQNTKIKDPIQKAADKN